MEKQPSYWALKQLFDQKFPVNGQRLFSLWFDHIIHPLYWGYWRDDSFGQGQRPWNTTDTLEKGWGKKLSKSRLLSHFLTQNKADFVFYVPSMMNILSGMRLIVPMFDIDDKKGGGDAHLVLARLKGLLPLVKFFSCPSTSGKGIHAFATIGFPVVWSAGTISDALHVLTDELSTRINDGSFNAQFDRITANPTLWLRGHGFERGVLGKVPSVRTDDEAATLLQDLSHVTEWAEISAALKLNEKAVVGEQAIAAPRQELVNVPAALAAEGVPLQKEGGRCITEPLAGSRCSAKQPMSLPANDIESLRAAPNTLARRQGFAFRLCRLMGRPLSAEELISKYESSGLATGPRTEARTTNFRQIAKYVAETFDPSKAGSKFETDLKTARSALASLLTDADVARNYGCQVNRSKLVLEDVSVVYAMYLTFSARKENVAIARTAAHSFSQKLKKSGLIDRTIDHKRFAAAKRILADFSLIKLKYKARKGATAATYTVFRPGDANQAKPKGVAEPAKDRFNSL